MCIYNQMIINRKYVKNQTNQGEIPTLRDKRMLYIPAGCGKCIECRKKYARDWRIRLLEHIKTHKNGKFITLTFNDKAIKDICEQDIKRTNKKTGEIETIQIKNLLGYDKDNTIATKAIHNFRNRWRKQFQKSPEHWLITELGHNGTENIHLHGIIWTDKDYDTIRNIWGYGYIWPRPDTKVIPYVSARTINYIVKYVSKVDQRNKEYKSKVLTSPGIGKDYINTINARQNIFRDEKTKEVYISSTGHKMVLPTYYRNKLYNEMEKEDLWINKLDQQTRFVMGQRIDISKGEKEYNDAVKQARILNKELGYGTRTNENRKEYEEQRREINIATRIARANKAPSAGS